MRIVIIGVLATGLALSGCSKQTQESAASAAQGAVSDTASNLDVASSAVSNAASDIGDHDNGTSTNVTSSVSGNTTTTTTTTTSTD